MRWQTIKQQTKKIILWGAGDQARVNVHILYSLGYEILAVFDDTAGFKTPFPEIPGYESWAGFDKWSTDKDLSDIGFVVSIGNPYGHIRCEIAEKLKAKNLSPISFADQSAKICSSTSYGEGLQVMPNALIHNEASIQTQCIINTMALVEHNCVLEHGVEIGPRATLCGRVHVEENSWIGAGTVILPRIRIGKNVIVGAGSVVTKDVPSGTVICGNPTQVMKGKVPQSCQSQKQR